MFRRIAFVAALLLSACGHPGGGPPDSTRTGPGGDSGRPQPKPRPPLGEFPAVQTRLPQVDLQIAASDLALLDANPTSNTEVPVVMTWDGAAAGGTVRYRGASTRTLPQKGFKVNLSGTRLDSRDKFELISEYLDSGKLSEKFSVDLFISMGLPIPDAQYVQVSVNGRPNGLYLDMMHVGRDYLSAAAMEQDATVYRCGGRNCEMKIAPPGSYQQDWTVSRADGTPGFADMLALEQLINRTDDADFEQRIASAMDLDAYLGNLATDALISNNLIEDARAFWVHELGRDLWTYVPWDLNNELMLWYRTWAVTDPPIVNREVRLFSVFDNWVQRIWLTRNGDPNYRPTWSVLNTRLWMRPALRSRILDKIDFGLAGPFGDAKAAAHVDALWALIQQPLAQDPYVDAAHAAVAPAFLKSYLRGRRTFLTSAVAQLRALGPGDLVINEVGFGGSGYVEILNRGGSTVDLGGLAITDDLRLPKKQVLAAGLTVPPGGYRVLWADGNPAAGPDHLAFTLPTSGGEVGLFDGVNVYGPKDLVYFGPRAAGTAYARRPNGTGDFAAGSPTPGAANP